MKAQRLETHVHAKQDQAIKPDADLKQAARIAAHNGSVNATIVRDGRTVSISSTNQPLIYVHTYYTEVNTEEAEFGIACEAVRHQLRNRK